MSRMLITGKPAEHISNTISRAIKYAPSVMKFNGTEIEVNFGDAPSIVDERWFAKQEEEDAEKATLMKQVDLAVIAEIRAEGIEEGRRLERERGVMVILIPYESGKSYQTFHVNDQENRLGGGGYILIPLEDTKICELCGRTITAKNGLCACSCEDEHDARCGDC